MWLPIAEEDQRLGDFTPAFLWLLRDFYLKLEEEGHAVSTQQGC